MTTTAAAFLGHGSPMNTLESNRFTRSWRQLGEAVPKPRAVLVISASAGGLGLRRRTRVPTDRARPIRARRRGLGARRQDPVAARLTRGDAGRRDRTEVGR